MPARTNLESPTAPRGGAWAGWHAPSTARECRGWGPSWVYQEDPSSGRDVVKLVRTRPVIQGLVSRLDRVVFWIVRRMVSASLVDMPIGRFRDIGCHCGQNAQR